MVKDSSEISSILPTLSRKLPSTLYSIEFAEPRTAHEVMCSKEGCRAIVSPYDQQLYILGGRSTHAIKKLEIYDPLKNKFTIVSNDCPTGLYNHTVVTYKS